MKKLASIMAGVLLCCGTAMAAPGLGSLNTTINALVDGTVNGLVETVGELANGQLNLTPTLDGTAGQGATIQGSLAAPLNATLNGLLGTRDQGQVLPNVLVHADAIPTTLVGLGHTLAGGPNQAGLVADLLISLVGQQSAEPITSAFTSGYNTLANPLGDVAIQLSEQAQPLFDLTQTLAAQIQSGTATLPGLPGM